ncbi:rhodanese-like domain-containing protein [Aliikangiella sp. IMCC44632]
MKSPIDLVKKAKQQINECSASELKQALNPNTILIDVREPNEYAQSQIPHAINIPRGLLEFSILQHPQVTQKAGESLAATPIYVYCKSGGRSALAAQSLQNLGFNNVQSLNGGIDEWQKHYPG